MGTGVANARAVQWGQSTPAMQAVFGGRAAAPRRRRKTRAAAPKRRKTAKRKTARRGKARLVKGSPAARRYMAKIRRMRKRK